MDRVIFTGLLPLDEVRERYPGWYRRLAGERPETVELRPEGPGWVPAAVSIVFVALGILMLLLVMSAALAEVVGYLVEAVG